jgi:hypothetical protein
MATSLSGNQTLCEAHCWQDHALTARGKRPAATGLFPWHGFTQITRTQITRTRLALTHCAGAAGLGCCVPVSGVVVLGAAAGGFVVSVVAGLVLCVVVLSLLSLHAAMPNRATAETDARITFLIYISPSQPVPGEPGKSSQERARPETVASLTLTRGNISSEQLLPGRPKGKIITFVSSIDVLATSLQ